MCTCICILYTYVCLYGTCMYVYCPLVPFLNIGQLATDLPEAARTLFTKNMRQTFRKTPTSLLLDGLYVNRLFHSSTIQPESQPSFLNNNNSYLKCTSQSSQSLLRHHHYQQQHHTVSYSTQLQIACNHYYLKYQFQKNYVKEEKETKKMNNNNIMQLPHPLENCTYN